MAKENDKISEETEKQIKMYKRMAKENDKISEETEKQINKKKRSLCDLEAITIVTNNV